MIKTMAAPQSKRSVLTCFRLKKHHNQLLTEEENPWPIYEQEKRKLPPDLTPDQYDEAIKAITKKLGI